MKLTEEYFNNLCDDYVEEIEDENLEAKNISKKILKNIVNTFRHNKIKKMIYIATLGLTVVICDHYHSIISSSYLRAENKENLKKYYYEPQIFDSNEPIITTRNVVGSYILGSDDNIYAYCDEKKKEKKQKQIEEKNKQEESKVVSEITINEKKSIVMSREKLKDQEQLSRLISYMITDEHFDMGFTNYLEALDYLYNNEERSYEEKMLVIMARHELSYDELNTVLACVCAEACPDYHDAYAVANAMFNRIYDVSLLREYGTNLFNHVKAPYQFTVYAGNCYQKYLGQIDYEPYKAGIDMFYTQILLHDYLEFRSNSSKMSENNYRQFADGGNKFKFVHCNPVNEEYKNLKMVESVEELDQELENFFNPESEDVKKLNKKM